jgi:hypothetical protein
MNAQRLYSVSRIRRELVMKCKITRHKNDVFRITFVAFLKKNKIKSRFSMLQVFKIHRSR